MVLTPLAGAASDGAGGRGAAEVAEREMRELIDWAAAVEANELPQSVLRRAALVLCDDIAAMLAARDEPEVRRVQDQLLARPAVTEASVFREGRPRTDRYSAAVANAVAANWCELDEGYRKATCHGGLCTLPALLAEAEAEGLTMNEVLRCLGVAYEVVTRFARAFVFKGLTLHPHATLAAIGAAAAMAAARKAPAGHFLDAVSAATTMVAPGPYNHAVKGALVRNVWAGVGAWVGMKCVDWAAFGIAGTASSAYDVFVDGLGAEFKAGEFRGAGGRLGNRGRLPQDSRLLPIRPFGGRGDRRIGRRVRNLATRRGYRAHRRGDPLARADPRQSEAGDQPCRQVLHAPYRRRRLADGPCRGRRLFRGEP